MVEARLFFGVTLPWNIDTNEPLKKLYAFRTWDKGKKEYVYVFPLERVDEVARLAGPVSFDELEVRAAAARCPVQERISLMESWKGKSGYEVIEQETVYILRSFQKEGPDSTPRRKEFIVPKERVDRLWNSVFSPIPPGNFQSFEYLAEHACHAFGLTRFFRASGSFDKEKFQGTRTSGAYGQFYYHPCKVLEFQGKIIRRGQYLAVSNRNFSENSSI